MENTNGKQKFSKELLKILVRAMEGRIYGSVEVYFEDGKITQITQRIINKVRDPRKEQKQSSESAEIQQPAP